MKKTIYFHIGQTKTATTTLQAFFADNRQWLAGHGVFYPQCPPEHPIQSQHRFLVEPLAGLQAPFPASLPEWDFMRRQIEAAPQKNVLISEEVFWHLFERRSEQKPEILEWIKGQLGSHQIKIVCYLRRQDKWIESWFNQLTKTDVNHYSRMNYAEFINAYENQGMLDYNKAMDPWAKVFGEKNLIVRSFEKGSFEQGDIIHDFMSIFKVDKLEGVVRPKDQQVSLANSACEISNIFNGTPRAREFKPKFMEIVREFDEHVDDRRRFTSKEIAEATLRRHSVSNQKLAKRFKVKLPSFFDLSMSDYERGEYPGLSSQELARFMIHLFQEQQSQIRNLRKRILELERK